ncbi:class I SAM-dependent methyltransferase [Frigidibacter sp. MR17.14]|uniref:class I SAM-dependent methyltransferase n=1 Tax=Frigidibacter sp. MR17.14 TaxID=3126509 RepID=UPI0030129CB3
MALSFLGQSFDAPTYVPPTTAWTRHGPFANWIVKAARPSTIVELGSHYGFSYFAFCQAVVEAGLPTRCYAVDTWQGDEHAGHYESTVHDHVSKANEGYAGFSALLRKTFAEALADIEDGSVDLLHVDGRHFYEDVREDFESWIPKLAPSAIVLFHDTEVRDRDFGVYRYWAELRQTHPGLNFTYQHGLGVLFWGEPQTATIARLREMVATPDGEALVNDFFFAASEAYVRATQAVTFSRQARETGKQLEADGARLASLRDKLSKLEPEHLRLRSEHRALKENLQVARRLLRKPLRTALHRGTARLALAVLPWLPERRKESLRQIIAKRELRPET